MTTTSYNLGKLLAALTGSDEWDRHEWMQEHGTWASAEWDDARKTRDEARETFADALREAAVEATVGEAVDLDFLATLHAAYVAAERACDGEIKPDENDYIEEGTIDPDLVKDNPGVKVWSQSWQGWDCTEGEAVYLAVVDGALRLVHRWYRDAYGQRHDRDLWRIAQAMTEAQDIAQVLDACREGDLDALLRDLAGQDVALARCVRDEADEGGAVAVLLDRLLPVEENEDAA